MAWGFYLLTAVLATAFGFAGGRLALATQRRRRLGGDTVPQAEFRLEHVDGMSWSLTNTGAGTGRLVSVLPFGDGLEQWPPSPVPGHVETVASELLPTLEPGDSMSVWLSRYDPGQRVIVSWTSESNIRMGPVMLDVPPPR